MKIYDISAELSTELETYDERLEIKQISGIEKGDVCNVRKYSLNGHIGTHADAPLHFIKDSAACHEVPLSAFVGECKVFRPRDLSAQTISALPINKGDRVLLDTRQWRPPLFDKNYKVLDVEAANFLKNAEIALLGVDALSIDAYKDKDFFIHKIILGANIPVLEGLCLEGVKQGRYTLYAPPLKFLDGDGSPVRALLTENEKISAVIFDLDGVIIDSEIVSKESWKRAFAQIKSKFEFSEEFFYSIMGRTAKAGEAMFCAAYEATAEDYNNFVKLWERFFNEHLDKHVLELKKGAREALIALRARNVPVAIATSSLKDGLQKKLRGLDILELVDACVTGDMISKSKPDPEIFLKAADALKVAPSECIVVEDSIVGIMAAYDAKMKPVFAPDQIKENLEIELRAWSVIDSLLNLEALL